MLCVGMTHHHTHYELVKSAKSVADGGFLSTYLDFSDSLLGVNEVMVTAHACRDRGKYPRARKI